MTEKEFMKNKEGVHLMSVNIGGEFTLCGYSFDDEEQIKQFGELKPSKSEIVTCENCIDILKYCKGVKYK